MTLVTAQQDSPERKKKVNELCQRLLAEVMAWNYSAENIMYKKMNCISNGGFIRLHNTDGDILHFSYHQQIPWKDQNQ